MKFKKLICTTLASSMLLVGCSTKTVTKADKTTKIVEGKYILASIDGQNISADEFYDSLIGTSEATQSTFNTIFMQLVNKECPVNSDMAAEIQQVKDQVQQYIDNGQEAQLLAQLQSYYGISSFEEYYQSYTESLQLQDFYNNYIKKNFDDIFEDYYELEAPKKVYHILVKMADSKNPTDEEMAKVEEIQKLLDQGKDFQETAKDYSDDGSASNGGYLGICGNSSQFVTEFLDMMKELKPGTISEPFSTTYGYHFMYIEETTKDDMKKELSDPDSVLMNWGSNYYDSYLPYVIYNTYDVKINDEDLATSLNAYVKSMLDAREALRK